MKKLSFVLILTLLLRLCSCAPAPNGKQIFDIKDPQSVELTLLPALALSAFSPDRFQTLLQEPAVITAICDLLNGLTLTEVDGSSGVLGGISNPVYYGRIMGYVKTKYHKAYVVGLLKGM